MRWPPTDGSAPGIVQQAATEAGYKLPPVGEDIGKPISVADMRPGDLIMGDKDRNGVFLGDGKALVGGEIRPVGDIARFTGPHQGIFRLDDVGVAAAPAPAADTPTPAPAASAAATPAPAPAFDPAPTVQGSVSEPAPAGGDQPTPAAEPSAPAAPGIGGQPVDTAGPTEQMPLPRDSGGSGLPGASTAAPTDTRVPVGD
ncbi:hypothetical protein EEB14_33340 [Rhodococcus sp. WS4]|nr:hypothetical protein EEB14_33340 [Rhodococcus sp. WS4]